MCSGREHLHGAGEFRKQFTAIRLREGDCGCIRLLELEVGCIILVTSDLSIHNRRPAYPFTSCSREYAIAPTVGVYQPRAHDSKHFLHAVNLGERSDISWSSMILSVAEEWLDEQCKRENFLASWMWCKVSFAISHTE